jgi:putative ABC transport system ATP-binding protein
VPEWLRRLVGSEEQGAERRSQTSGAVSGHTRGMTEAMISLQNVTKAYETDAGPFWALKGIDLQIYPGEFVAVVGKSGSGKSTLINVFTGIDHPTGGEVVVARTRIRQLDEGRMAEWRGRKMGIVFQFFQLLPTLSIVENVMLPMDLCDVYEPGERQERAMFLLDQMGMAELAGMFPGSVSGGHQQRAAIARALAIWTARLPMAYSDCSSHWSQREKLFSWSRMTVNWRAAYRAFLRWQTAWLLTNYCSPLPLRHRK